MSIPISVSRSMATGDERHMPVKIVIERLARPDAEDLVRSWAERVVADASRARGHEGSSVLSAPGGVHVILLRFDSAASLADWQGSVSYAALMHEAEAHSTSDRPTQIRSGLETWFTLPDRPAPARPPAKWKMALVTWSALLPMVIGLAYALAPLRLPFLAEVAASTAIPVAMLTWVVMPFATKVLYGWLYRAA